jgi:uncharacterized protein (TIGR03437 family)
MTSAGSSTSAQITLTNNSGSTVNFSIPLPTTTSGGAWLGASAGSYSLANGSSTLLTISAPNGVTLANNTTYYGTITFTPSGTAPQISVTLTVGSGSGTGIVTASINPIAWSYSTASPTSFPAAQAVTLTTTSGASYYTASVNPSGSWLAANNSTTTTSGYFSSGSSTIIIQPNQSVMSTLTAGATGYVYVTDSLNNQVTIIVNLTVNGSGTATGITWLPNPATLPAAALGGSTVSLTVYVASSTAGTFSSSAGISGSGLSVSAVSTLTSTTASVVVFGVPGSLPASTYYGTLVVYFTPTGGTQVSQAIPVSFTVGSGTITTSSQVTPTSLAFAYQSSSSSIPPAQNIVVTGTGTFSVAAPVYPTGQAGGTWLSIAPSSSGTAPGTISVSIPSPGSLPAGTYTATVAVTPYGGSATNVSVSFLVTASPVLVANPGSLYFTYNAGNGTTYSPVFLTASDGSADVMPVTVTTTATWLSVTTPATTGTEITVQGNNLASLPNGVYTGSVTVTAPSAANNPVNIPVVLVVTGSTTTGGSLTLGTLTTFSSLNGSTPASQTLTVGSSTSNLMYYSASASSTGNWLSISPSGSSLNTFSNPSISVSVNPYGLTANTYYGTITLQASGSSPQYVSVTLVVSSSSTGGSGNVTVSPTTLSFTYQVGGTAPTPQYLQVTSASGSAQVAFTISSSATWLSTGVQSGGSLITPYNNPGITISIVTPITLTPSSTPYSASITITPTGGTVVTVPVSFTVNAAPTVTATSTPLAFTYQVGGASPPTQTISVSGGGQALGYTATVTSGSNWLSVSPTSGTTTTTGTTALVVTATPGNLAASATPYAGTIVVAGTGTAGGSTTINVTLTISAPLPTIASVVNAASFLRGSVSPGEIVTLFGTNMGPTTAAYANVDSSTGKLATNIGGVQVFFNGILAPMIYASAGQISAIVPYEMAPIASPSVWVKYVGQTSNAYQLTSATTAPGIFTQNASGSGPGAILNQDGITLNGPGHPAPKGSIVTVYLTGEGVTSCGSPVLCNVTGAITSATLPPPQVTPAPLYPVGVLINGQPALYTYAGEAPGLAAGLLQLNVQIPATAQSGVPNSITVSIGSNISQNGVTVSVQ